MSKHIISTEDLEHFESKTRLAGQHGKGVNKSLDMCVYPLQKRIWFEVSNHRTTIASVPDLKEAIETYNNL